VALVLVAVMLSACGRSSDSGALIASDMQHAAANGGWR
jgi:hypothetical protein